MTNSRNRLLRSSLVAFALAALTFGTLAPAMADPNSEGDPACTENDYQATKCLWFAASPGEDYLEQGLGQAIERGDDEIVEQFVANYAEVNELSPSEAEGLVSRAESSIPVEGASPTRAADSTEDATGQVSPLSGTTSGFTNIIADTVSYGTCGTGSCTVIGRTRVDFRYELEGVASYSINGDIDVVSGPRIDLEGTRCRTRFNNGIFPDITVHTWSNCSYWGSTTDYVTRRTIWGENWTGGTRGEVYHSDYRVSFRVEGGATVTKSWRGHDYKIRESGSLRPYWV